jgi:hypothetical protein
MTTLPRGLSDAESIAGAFAGKARDSARRAIGVVKINSAHVRPPRISTSTPLTQSNARRPRNGQVAVSTPTRKHYSIGSPVADTRWTADRLEKSTVNFLREWRQAEAWNLSRSISYIFQALLALRGGRLTLAEARIQAISRPVCLRRRNQNGPLRNPQACESAMTMHKAARVCFRQPIKCGFGDLT